MEQLLIVGAIALFLTGVARREGMAGRFGLKRAAPQPEAGAVEGADDPFLPAAAPVSDTVLAPATAAPRPPDDRKRAHFGPAFGTYFGNFNCSERLPDGRAALAADARAVGPGRPDNLSLECAVGDASATDAAFAKAAHVVRFESRINRITGSPMEPRAAIGEYDAATGKYTLRAASGRGVVQTRERLAVVLGMPIEQCRAVFGDMGGNFGTRNAFSPEFAIMPWAAKRVGRPVKWVANRSECFLSDYQGRDLAVRAEMALDADGAILAMRGENVLNLGAYSVYFWPLRKGLSMMQGVYDVPTMHFTGKAAFTNTPPIAVYRSAGRPEATFVIERLVETAAKETGIAPAELRRRNIVPVDAYPYQTPVIMQYDCGDYGASLDEALRIADYTGFGKRKAEAQSRGKLRGIGFSSYIEACGIAPSAAGGSLGAGAGCGGGGASPGRPDHHRNNGR